MAGVGPQVVQVLDFATARAPELQALHEASQGAADAKLSAQRNQRRRRANAFKSHKMPRRLRLPVEESEATTAGEEEHIALGNRRGASNNGSLAPVAGGATRLAAGAAKARAKREAQGPRCRKHRRRMHLLLQDRSWLSTASEDQDQGVETPKWLATHAWHAKRMRMREAYGHVLAQKRQDKGVSAALTALRKTATLHDASYVGLLELFGVDALILEALQLVTDPSGSEFDEAQMFSGAREGRAVLYHASQFPSGAIAPVRFQWRPLKGDEPGEEQNDDQERAPRKRQLWLWIHAAAFMEAATAIASACQEVMSEQDGAEAIEILDRRGHLARFELRGRAASAMVDKVLRKPASRLVPDEDGNTSDHDDGFTRSEIFTTTAHSNFASLQGQLRKRDSGKSSYGDQGTNVFTVCVQDPRLRSASNVETPNDTSPVSLLHEPTVDAASPILCPLSGMSLTSADADEPDSASILAQLDSLLQWTTSNAARESTSKAVYPYVASAAPTSHKKEPTDVSMGDADAESTAAVVACSELWSLSGRARVRRNFVKDHALNRMKQRGGDGDNAPSHPVDVPLMLVQQPGAFPSTGGWDLIVSPVYASAFLNALVFSGVMVVGLDEQEALATVAHEPSFPRDFPDTAAGVAYWDQINDAQESEYAKKPKAKRVAYDKLGVQSPFQPTWDMLFDETSVSDDEDGEHSNDGDVEMEQEPPTSSLCVLRSTTYMEPFPFSRALTHDQDDTPVELIPVAVPTLIRVALSFPRRAALEPCSMLYIPTEADLVSFHKDAKWSGRDWEHDSELELLGFVTSAVYDRPMSAFRGTAFCACEALQRLAIAQLERHGKKAEQLLALTRTPSSRQLRPVVLQIQA